MMQRITDTEPFRTLRWLFCVFLLATASIATGEKLSMSGEVTRVIDAQGPEVARNWFAETYPAQKDLYAINTAGMAELASRYMQNGNVEAARAVGRMLDQISQNMLDEALKDPE